MPIACPKKAITGKGKKLITRIKPKPNHVGQYLGEMNDKIGNLFKVNYSSLKFTRQEYRRAYTGVSIGRLTFGGMKVRVEILSDASILEWSSYSFACIFDVV